MSINLSPEQQRRFSEAWASCRAGNVRILDDSLRTIPARAAFLSFWREYLSWESGLESMLRREKMPDADIQKRLDDEYAKAWERLEERVKFVQ